MTNELELIEVLRDLRAALGRPDPVHFTRLRAVPPGAHYVTGDDQLVIQTLGFTTGFNYFLRARVLQPNGEITPFELTRTTTAASEVRRMRLTEGFLLGVNVEPQSNAGASPRGSFFVRVGIGRGEDAPTLFYHTLISDYLEDGHSLAWPGGLMRASVEGPGSLVSQSTADPAAGAEISFSVPADRRMRIRTLRFQLVTAIAVANRQVHIVLDDSANVFYDHPALAVQVASTTVTYVAAPGVQALTTTDGVQVIPLPQDTMMFVSWRLRTVTTGIQAADDFGPAEIVTEDWQEES